MNQRRFDMTYKELKNSIKEEQKSLAQEIRAQKSKRKEVPFHL